MKWLVNVLFFVVLLILFGEGVSAENSLQLRINAIPEGGTLRLEAGVYEDEIQLNKPIVLEGEAGTVFKSCSPEPMITISGKNVFLKNIKIVGCKNEESLAEIVVSGKNHLLEEITINTWKIAIKLEDVEDTLIRKVRITGNARENGIDLWQSNRNAFENIELNGVEDGFYLENSHNNIVLGNTIRNSRYGIHIMFSDKITVKDNLSERNFTGAMIMASNQSIIEDNKFTENNRNVNAQGILLYDVHDSKVSNNYISKNRVGMFIEGSSGNKITDNEVMANFIGTQLLKNKNNVIEGNSYIGNVTEMQANQGTTNTIHQNYWDVAMKLDTDGNGKSNLPFQADPYFLNLAKETPAYQLFFQHPGMVLLQKVLKSPKDMLVTDVEPLMKNQLQNNDQQNQGDYSVWLISLVMISSSLLFILYGRKRG
jgi:nitrous oxidase accessory protein